MLGDMLATLAVLSRHRVDFIIVGGVCAVLHGAPVSTVDLDLVHSRSEDNAARLLAALQELEAWFREHPENRPAPSLDDLRRPGHLLLMTVNGPLDLLGQVTGERGYEELVSSAKLLQLADGSQTRLLDLETLIELKQELGRDKDLIVLPVLRRTLSERESS